ncbi:MAG: response regulator transcription factor [Nitrospira sp.]|nr:response regulator transcription factor [Nitrospira sp.]MDH5347362.1 response regulator transcription factor [Nitrospira sp.]
MKETLSQYSEIVVVATAHTKIETFDCLRTYRPDVAVLDVRVGRASGIEMCRTMRKFYQKSAVIFLTANDDKRLLRSAILAGAQGYLLKMASGEAVAKAIEIVAAGQAIMDPELTQEIFEWIRDKTRPVQRERVDDGSEFDNQVLALIAAGKTNQEIARRLNVTPRVLLTRLRIIYKRLNISRKADAASYLARPEQGAFGMRRV